MLALRAVFFTILARKFSAFLAPELSTLFVGYEQLDYGVILLKFQKGVQVRLPFHRNADSILVRLQKEIRNPTSPASRTIEADKNNLLSISIDYDPFLDARSQSNQFILYRWLLCNVDQRRSQRYSFWKQSCNFRIMGWNYLGFEPTVQVAKKEKQA